MITAVLLLWLFLLGLLSQTLWCWLEAPWERQPAVDAASADAIVVLWVSWAKQLPLLGASIALASTGNLGIGLLLRKKNH